MKPGDDFGCDPPGHEHTFRRLWVRFLAIDIWLNYCHELLESKRGNLSDVKACKFYCQGFRAQSLAMTGGTSGAEHIYRDALLHPGTLAIRESLH